jgi:methanogenic corrinoid protein MtbC1
MNNDELAMLERAILDMDKDLAYSLAKKLAKDFPDVLHVVEESLVKAMREVADSYDRKEIFLPQVLATVNAFYSALRALHPSDGAGPSGRHLVLIGVVEGDMHDIGKNLVKVMLDANGFSCLDMGRNVPTDQFVDSIARKEPKYVALSTLMSTTMVGMQEVLQGMAVSGLRAGRLVMVGGGPVNRGYAECIGADFYGKEARDAVGWVREWEGAR